MAKRVTDAIKQLRVVGYVRVSTDEQAGSGLGLSAQRSAIREEVNRRGWKMVRVFEDAASGKSMNGRRGLEQALDVLESGRASALVVAKLDRLSRSLLDFAELMERGQRRGWTTVALDLGVDTTTPAGETMANMLAVFSQFERRLIGQRTRDALAVKVAKGEYAYGRPPFGYRAEGGVLVVDDSEQAVIARMVELRGEGASLRRIVQVLTDEGLRPRQGAKWYPTTVADVLRRV